MTEAEWTTAAEPAPMLDFVRATATDRKLRLFAVAVIRHYFGERFAAEYGPRIAAAERIADGLAPVDPRSSYWIDGRSAQEAASRAITEQSLRGGRHAGHRKCRLLRDIFGNPFRPVAADPSWLSSTAVALAVGIYEQSAFDRLPILADALQDAGCNNEAVLGHCRLTHRRQPVEHVRGCWVVDLVLGKT
jgi:hypothetical protein